MNDLWVLMMFVGTMLIMIIGLLTASVIVAQERHKCIVTNSQRPASDIVAICGKPQ